MDALARLLPFLKPHLKRLIIGIAGMSLFTLLSLAPPLLLRFLINDVIVPGAWQFLSATVLFIIAIPASGWLIQFVTTRSVMLTGFRVISDVRLSIYRKVMNASMRFHNDRSSGVVVNRLMDDVNMFQYLLTGETVTMIVDLIVFVCSVTIVFTLSVPLGALILVILVIYVVAYRFFAARIRRASTSYRDLYDRISERLQETVAGVRQVRIYNREYSENNRFLDRTETSLHYSLTSSLNSVGLSTVCNAIAGFGSATIAVLGAWYVLLGRLEYGDVVAVNTYIWMALTPAIRLTSLAGQITETLVSVRRVAEILEEPDEVTSAPEAPPLVRGPGAVEFRDVHFGYTPDVPLYRGLSVSIAPGTTVALVGHTGCGKTTFTQLLMRYWDVASGAIMIDGQNVREVELRSLREQFGVVLQDPVIFDGTLAENISYAAPGTPRDRIVEAAKAAEIHQVASRLEAGYDTQLGTRGVELSLGEKQRISIARALVTDPMILVMDEATSSLDSESELLIQRALSRVLEGRTSFVVAHRLSTIVGADLILVMDAGAIVEQGRHAQLMTIDGGRYRHLYEELRSAGRPAVDGGDPR